MPPTTDSTLHKVKRFTRRAHTKTFAHKKTRPKVNFHPRKYGTRTTRVNGKKKGGGIMYIDSPTLWVFTSRVSFKQLAIDYQSNNHTKTSLVIVQQLMLFIHPENGVIFTRISHFIETTDDDDI